MMQGKPLSNRNLRNASRAFRREGFSLITIIIALAVVAILAGTVGPLAFRQMMQAKEQQTLREMATLEEGFLDFLEDTGRFPTEAEGVAALFVDPGIEGWQGPYLPGEREDYTADAFGRDYIIDKDPNTNPAGSAGLILVSSGMDQALSAGNVNELWTVDDAGDDLLVLVESGSLTRQKIIQARDEMQILSNGAQRYFYDKAAFPTTTAMLAGAYLDENNIGNVFVDPWFQNYTVTVDNSLNPPVMTLRSLGPDQADNSGSGDDIVLQVESKGPGRQATVYMLNIIQAAVTNNEDTDLTGDWGSDYTNFTLGTAFVYDGWGKRYEEAMSTRTILSGGPDADYFTAADNIPPGVVPDDEGGISAWDVFGSYTIGDVVSHEGDNWECRQSHDGSGDPNWAPGIAHSLWLLI